MAEVCGALAGSVGGGAYLSDVPLFEEASVFAAVLGGVLAVGGGWLRLAATTYHCWGLVLVLLGSRQQAAHSARSFRRFVMSGVAATSLR